MVRMTYPGLGTPEAAVREFDAFRPYVRALRILQRDCAPDSPDFLALDIPVDGLETAAFHFTRRPHYYEDLRLPAEPWRTDHPGLGHNAAIAAFGELEPYVRLFAAMRLRCRPQGRDYQAIRIATAALDTAVYHFTGRTDLYAGRPLGHSS